MGFLELISWFWRTFGVLATLFFVDLSLWPVARYVLPHIKNRTIAAIFHIVTGVAFCCVLFFNQMWLTFAMVTITYIGLHLSTTAAIVIDIVCNCLVHIWLRFYSLGQWKFECSCLTMIVFQKVLATAFNLKHYKDHQKGKKIRPFHQDYMLEKIPSVLEWFAYCYSPYGGNSGPAIEFKLFDIILDAGNRPHIADDSEDRKMARKRWFMAIGYGIANAIFMPYAGLRMYDTPFFQNLPVLLKPIMVMIFTVINISRYFCAWLNVDAGYYELGLGSTGFSTFESVSNGHLGELFQARSVGHWIQIWNHSTHLMWKNYIFYPLKDAGVPYFYAHNATFAASALWHGFHPVYYLVLPEMLLATTADLIFEKYFKITDKTPVWKTIPRRFWIYASMLNSISTWWFRTYASFIKIKTASHWLLTIFIVSVFIFAEVYDFIMKAKIRKQKKLEKKDAAEQPKKEDNEKEKVEAEKEKEEQTKKEKND